MKSRLHRVLGSAMLILKKPWVLFLLFGVVGSVIFYFRFPNNYLEPNFYAEDGSIFFNNIYTHGFLTALFTPFNGYFIIGLYILEEFGRVINFIFFGNELVNMARSLSIISYLFLGFTCALPFLLFKRYFNIISLVIIFILSAFIPLPGSDYAIIGTIGNSKFIFVYIAFVFIAFRNLIPEKSLKFFIATDTILLLCAYTNVTVYALLPFALLRYLPHIKEWRTFSLRVILGHWSFRSLAVLIVLLLPQLIMIKLIGIPKLPGYLDAPYNSAGSINMFVYRSFLFPLIGPLKISMNDMIAVVLFACMAVGLWITLKKHRTLMLFSYFVVVITTLLFVANRTGVSELFLTYIGSGPDQFFYTQNLVITFLIGLSLGATIRMIKPRVPRLISILLLIAYVLLLYIPSSGTYGKDDFMQRTVHNIYLNSQASCRSNSTFISIQLYPIVSSTFQLKNINRAAVCRPDITSYVPATEYINLQPQAGDYIPNINQVTFTQTFRSDYDGLNGVDILLLTYGKDDFNHYHLLIYDSSCTYVIEQAEIDPLFGIKDAEYTSVYFPRISNSESKNYCLTITPSGHPSGPLALPLSISNNYPQGVLTIDGKNKDEDIVFQLHYTK